MTNWLEVIMTLGINIPEEVREKYDERLTEEVLELLFEEVKRLKEFEYKYEFELKKNERLEKSFDTLNAKILKQENEIRTLVTQRRVK